MTRIELWPNFKFGQNSIRVGQIQPDLVDFGSATDRFWPGRSETQPSKAKFRLGRSREKRA